MERICTNCGSPLMEGALFCAECGARLEEPENVLPAEDFTAAPEEMAVNNQEEEAKPLWAKVPPAPVMPEEKQAPSLPEREPLFKAVKTSTYFWLILLFAVPLIGLIAMLIIAFTAKNNNLRNFARAHLIWCWA